MEKEGDDDSVPMSAESPQRTVKCTASRRVLRRVANVIFPANIDLAAFLPLVLLLICEGIAGSSINSYVGYLIVDVGAASSTNEVGTWAGVLSSSFFICQFFSSMALGFVSDRFGRRPTLLIGAAGSFVTQFAFGFSRNIWVAIAIRSANGLVNGITSTIKACMGEISDATNRSAAFAWVGLSFAVGNIAGSFLGGVLARPAVAYPGVFSQDGFFGRFPYALANIVTSVLVFVAFVAAVIFVKETRKDTGKPTATSQKKYKRIGDEPEATGGSTPGNDTVGVELEAPADESLDAEPEVPEAAKKSCLGKLSKIRAPATAILQYTVMSGVNMIMMQMVSVWTVATVDAGGLGFSASDVGILNAISACAVVTSLTFVVGPVVKRLKVLWSIRVASLVLIPIVCSTPLSSTVAKHGGPSWAVWLVAGSLVFGWQLVGQVAMTNSIMMISNSVPPHQMGRANGVGQACGSLMRAVSPITVGPLLVWCLMPGRKFPLNSFLPFFITGGLALTFALCSFLLPQSINYPFGYQPTTASPPKAKQSPAVPSEAQHE